MPSSATPFTRHVPARTALPSLMAEATRLRRYTPPFRFTSFFSPEDTLLCVIAAEAALGRSVRLGIEALDDALDATADAPPPVAGAPRQSGAMPAVMGLRIVELTAGSGLVGLRLLDLAPDATLLGTDIDAGSPIVATENARGLGLLDRVRFARQSLWDDDMEDRLRVEAPDVLVCNPPYIPEPASETLAIEAGSGRDGAAHLRRVIALAARVRPTTLALSWCSLSDPAGVVRDAERAGYALEALYVVAIADGEYSGSVHRYLRTVPTAFLSENPEAIAAVAPDGSARFAYLLMSGVFVDTEVAPAEYAGSAAGTVDHLVRDFVERGPDALIAPVTHVPVQCWVLDRWDEVALRAYLHGALAEDERMLAPAPAVAT